MTKKKEECIQRFPIGTKIRTLTGHIDTIKNHDYCKDNEETVWFMGNTYGLLVYSLHNYSSQYAQILSYNYLIY